jgi:hypothetical protein
MPRRDRGGRRAKLPLIHDVNGRGFRVNFYVDTDRVVTGCPNSNRAWHNRDSHTLHSVRGPCIAEVTE